MGAHRHRRPTRDRRHQNRLTAGAAELVKTRLETADTLAFVADLFAAVCATVEELVTWLGADVVACSIARVSAVWACGAALDMALVTTAALRAVARPLANIFLVNPVARLGGLGLATAAVQLHDLGTGRAGRIVTDSLALVATGKRLVTNCRAGFDWIQAAVARLNQGGPAAGAGLGDFGVSGARLAKADMAVL